MILCLDLGNTRLKYALFEGAQLRDSGFIADLSLPSITKIIPAEGIHLLAICSVIDIPSDVLASLQANYSVHFIAKEDTNVLFTDYDSSTLGLDRLILAEGCLAQFPAQNCLCICLGTCITYNLISSGGEFLGGAISPGIHLRSKAMSEFTDKLPLVELKSDFTPFGKDTLSNLHAGVMAGALFEMQGFVATAKEEFPDLRVILTGGDAEYYKDQFEIDPLLAWKGFLRMIPKD
ncbi:MAG: Pantothenate kinase [Bacteroidota bacterium]|jgi:type III pantothenate kinase